MEEDFKGKLTPEQYRVMRERGTETPHTGKYWDHDETGIYTCAACGSILFLSLNKLEAESGWPTFTKPARERNVVFTPEDERMEVSCKKCASHLGYVVEEDGKKQLQINSIALGFLELPDIDWDESDDSQDQNKQQTQQSPSTVKTISLTIGGLTIGAALGAGFMWQSAPPQGVCTPSAAQLQAMSAPANTEPKPTPTTRPTPAVSPAATVATTSTATTTPAAANSGVPAGSTGSAATTTP